MSLIKSAWEIAMEKTENIQADPEKIRREALINEGKHLAGSYLTDIEAELEQVKTQYELYPQDKRELVRKGILTTVLMNIALPQSEEYEERLQKLYDLTSLTGNTEDEASDLLKQIGQFMEKYLQARDTLLERVKKQYQMPFNEKQERITQKYGKGVNISMEQDPEFIQLLQKSYAQLSSQYQQVLDQAKGQLSSLWDL